MTYKIVRYSNSKIQWFDIHTYCERIPFMELINTSITSYIYLFLFGENFSTLLAKFQSYNTVLSTIVTVLYIRSSALTPLIAESLYCLTSLFLFPSSPSPWQPLFYCFYGFDILWDSTEKWCAAVFAFICLAYFTSASSSFYSLTYTRPKFLLCDPTCFPGQQWPDTIIWPKAR